MHDYANFLDLQNFGIITLFMHITNWNQGTNEFLLLWLLVTIETVSLYLPYGLPIKKKRINTTSNLSLNKNILYYGDKS